MVQYITQFGSYSNLVGPVAGADGIVVCKEYRPYGCGNALPLCISRMHVEAYLMHALLAITARIADVVVPCVLQLDGPQRRLWMSRLGGMPCSLCLLNIGLRRKPGADSAG